MDFDGLLKTLSHWETIKANYESRDSAEEDQIIAFEQKHRIHLPEQYRFWLRITDGGEFFLPGGIQLYGVAHKPIINVDCNDRPNENYIVIGALSNGDPILCQKEGEEISIFNRSTGRIEPDEVYPDFFSFLADLVNLLGIEEG